jgi:hypothetical protein
MSTYHRAEVVYAIATLASDAEWVAGPVIAETDPPLA